MYLYCTCMLSMHVCLVYVWHVNGWSTCGIKGYVWYRLDVWQMSDVWCMLDIWYWLDVCLHVCTHVIYMC